MHIKPFISLYPQHSEQIASIDRGPRFCELGINNREEQRGEGGCSSEKAGKLIFCRGLQCHVMLNGGKIPSVEHHVILSFPISSPSPLEIHPSLLQSVARTV